MIVDQLFTPKLIREGQVYDLGHKSLSEALELYFGKNSKPISEGNRNNRLRLMEETTFRNGYAFARLLVEKNLTKDQVQQLFKSIETRATRMGQTGAGVSNRTGLGKAKDATTQAIGSAQDMLASARKWVKERPTYQAVDTEYNKAMTALGKVGGNSGEANAVAKAIYKYRDAAKKYPRATGLAKWAIISAAGFLTGGLGGVGVAAGLAAIDSALKDKELVDIVGDAGIAALVSGGIQGAGDLVGAADVPADDGTTDGIQAQIDAQNAELAPDGVATDAVPSRFDQIVDNAVDYKIKPNDTLSQILADRKINPEAFYRLPGNEVYFGPDGNPNIIKAGQIIKLPDPADILDLNKMSGTTPSDPNLAKGFGDTNFYTGVYNQNSALGLDAANNLKQQEWGRLGSDNGMSAARVAQDAGTGMSQADVSNFRADNLARIQDQADAAYYQGKPDDVGIPARSNDAVGTGMPGSAGDPTFYKIDYSQPGPVTTDSMGQKLEYGIPVNDQGSFKAPNPGLQPEELAGQKTAYNNWLTDFKSRYPNATQLPDGSWQGIKPGLAPMQILTKPTLPAAVQESVWSKVAESVRVKVLPNNLLIDNKLTVMAWALNESTNRDMGHGVQLTKLGVRTIFENIGRYRQAYLKEYVGAPTTDYGHPTAAGAPVDATAGQSKQGWFGKTLDTIGKGVDKVAGWAGNVGHNIITKVTADKLNNAWNRAGEPYDSDKIYDFLLAQKVPKEVIDNVYQRMTLTAPAKTGGAQRQAYAGTNPATGKPWTVDELQARMQSAPAPAPAPADTEEPADAGAGAFGNIAGQLAARPTTSSTGGTTTGVSGVVRHTASATNPNQPKPVKPTATPAAEPSVPSSTAELPAGGGAGFRDANPFGSMASSLSGNKAADDLAAGTATLPAGGGAGVKAAAQTKPGFLQTATDKIADKSKTQSMNSNDTQADTKKALDARRAAGLSAYESKTNESRILQALKRPVAEMLQMVETKEDVQRIKQFVDDTFVKYGAVTESAFVIRNRLIEHVTQVGAQRRREHARKS